MTVAHGARYYGRTRWALLTPLLAFMALLVIIPVFYGVLTALQHNTLSNPVISFAGLQNFAKVLTDPLFWHSVLFTVQYTIIVVAIEMVLGILIALLFDHHFLGKRFLFSFIIMPLTIASSLIAVVSTLMFDDANGLVPALLRGIGLNISFLSTQRAGVAVMLTDILQWTPLVVLIVYAGLQSVPQDMYESAELDGAGYWQTVGHIVLPYIRPVLYVVVFLRTADAFRTFDNIFALTGGGPGTSTTNVSVYIYTAGFTNGNFGVGAAASVIVLILLFALIPFATRAVRL